MQGAIERKRMRDNTSGLMRKTWQYAKFIISNIFQSYYYVQTIWLVILPKVIISNIFQFYSVPTTQNLIY